MKLDLKKLLDYYVGGLGLAVLGPLVFVAGRLLHRDHDSEPRGDIVVVKMLGAGSLVIAMPALLGIRQRFPERRLGLVTTRAVQPFARSLGVFDDIVTIDDRSLLALLSTGLRAWWRCLFTDTMLDFEPYSRLTTVFMILCTGRNRFGFYLEAVGFRRYVYTHLAFFNRFSGSFHFYEKLAEMLGAEPLPFADCSAHMRSRFVTAPVLAEPQEGALKIAIGHACSELGRERMLSPLQWAKAVESLSPGPDRLEITVLGGPADRDAAEKIIAQIQFSKPEATLVNLCGEASITESLQRLSAADRFMGIDSALLHYARLFLLPTTSFWGPTDPATRLKGLGEHDTVHYRKIPCSPCIHVAEEPPCGGDNHCIKNLFSSTDFGSAGWVPSFAPRRHRKAGTAWWKITLGAGATARPHP